MKKKRITLSVFDANPFVLFCVFYTVSLVITVLINILMGEAHTFYFNLSALLDGAVFNATPIITWTLFNYIPPLKHLNEDTCSPWVSVPVHYVLSCAVLLLAVFVLGRFTPVTLRPHWNTILSYTMGYAIIVSGGIVIELRKTAAANRNLKKIQDSLNKNKNR